jgi:hypothetical protein
MRKTLIAFVFAIFSAGVPLMMAKAVAQEDTSAVTISESGSNVRIEIDGLDSDHEDRIRDVLEGLGDVFGDQFRAELEVEFDDLTSSERDRLNDALDRLVDHRGIKFYENGIGFGETVVALTAISLTLGLPIIILLVVFIFAQKKRRQMMELANMYIQADQPMPQHIMTEFGTGMSADKRLRSGIQMLLLGIAATAILGTLAGEEAVLGFIPIAIGLARILYWRYESRSERDRQAELLELPSE